MKFSVLMSVYINENADFFEKSLWSILDNQSLKPDEFVLVCDGTLNTELDEIIEKYISFYPDILRVYRLDHNQGLGKALNFGLSYCSNEYIARADSDDLCAEDRFKKQMDYLGLHPDVAVLGSDIFEFDQDPSNPKFRKSMPSSHDLILKMAKFRNPVNHMTVVFKKSAVEAVGSYIHLPQVEDYYLWVRLLVHGYKIENLKEPLVFARVGNGMAKRRGNKAYIKSWFVLCQYMYKNRMINRFVLVRNLISVSFFVLLPANWKQFLYKQLLREKDV
ncbi:MAG: glycosyltransferase [Eubacteriales bacterium]